MRSGDEIVAGREAMNREEVSRVVETTRAIRWWIDEQIRRGRSSDEIEAELPYAVAFITGRIHTGELLALATAT